jgi:hypothetical protein
MREREWKTTLLNSFFERERLNVHPRLVWKSHEDMGGESLMARKT